MTRSAFGEPYWLIDRLFRKQLMLVSDYIRGELLDAGCGDMPFREILKPLVRSYVGVDRRQREGIVVGDLRNLAFNSESFDTVVCFQVLDDFPEPGELLCELHRVLRVSGSLILSVNQQWRLHDAPNDYYRYTAYGLRHLLGA